MNKQRNLTIPLMWQLLRDLRVMVEETLEGLSKDVQDATSMVAAELVSNAIKYGVSVPAAPSAHITLTVTDSHIKISVSNGVNTRAHLQELEDMLNQIAGAESKEELYLRRLQQMLDDPAQTGKLGLYRIGFEGQFDLTYTYINDVLTVQATRGVA